MKINKSAITLFVLFLSFSFITGSYGQTKRKSPPVRKAKSPAAQKQVSVPSNNVLQSLLIATIADFTNSIKKEDFTDLLISGSKDFRAGFSPEQLKTNFQPFIDKKDVVLPSLYKVSGTTATFSAPFIRTEKGYKVLVTTGEFPTRPYAVKFDNEYVLENGAWKLLAIKVNM